MTEAELTYDIIAEAANAFIDGFIDEYDLADLVGDDNAAVIQGGLAFEAPLNRF